MNSELRATKLFQGSFFETKIGKNYQVHVFWGIFNVGICQKKKNPITNDNL